MKIGSIATLLAALALALGLAACGGSDSGGDTAAADTSAAETTEPTTESESPETTESEGSSTSSGELTPPGTQLKSGESANVIWVPFDENDFEKEIKGIPITATVEIEEGTADDLDNVELDPGEEDSTPFFVKLTLEATSGKEPAPDEEPDLAFNAIDDRGQEQGSVTFILGDFEPCEEEERPTPFTNGESYETCLTYLIPGGGSIEEIRWDDGPSEAGELSDYYDDPVVWTP